MNSVTDTASFSIGDRRKRICTGFLFLVHFKSTINNNTKVFISQTHVRTHLYVVRSLPYTSSRVDCVNVILKCVINCQRLFQVLIWHMDITTEPDNFLQNHLIFTVQTMQLWFTTSPLTHEYGGSLMIKLSSVYN